MKIIQKDRFERCIKQYERLIFTICLSFTKNYFDAEDLAQETFLSAGRNFDKFDGRNIKAWLASIAANKCRDYLRSRVRSQATNTCSIYSEGFFEQIEDSNDTPEDIAIKKDAHERVRNLCAKLKEPYKTVASRYFCDNLELSEMARSTGQKLKTLQTQLYRAKKQLKILWEEQIS